MFDLRYHVASLAAVFLALITGILLGVGISSGGFVKKSERRILNDRIHELAQERDAARARVSDLARGQRAATTYVEQSYPVLMEGLLQGKHVAVVFIGPVDPEIRDAVEEALSDSGAGLPVRMRAVRVPVDLPALGRTLAGRPALARYAKRDAADDLGRRLAQELVAGGKTPAWRALAPQLVEERSGSERRPADGVVVVRTVSPQQGETARMLHGFYQGLAGADVPAVGVETSGAAFSAITTFDREDLSSVDYLETRAGRLALALLLAGARKGTYGLKPTARSGVLPPFAGTASGGR